MPNAVHFEFLGYDLLLLILKVNTEGSDYGNAMAEKCFVM